ncbi:hypothetical protein V5N11_029821 [Cardamine amara subsp. amara]|uniref:Uncharacterized protein n=1 Tax=Cardamine amara subsp. amara TaxID=228776 RepID=A0ABD1ALK5_CARAN
MVQHYSATVTQILPNSALYDLHRAVKRLKYLRDPSEPASKVTNVVPPVVATVKPVEKTQIDINNPVSLDHENEEDPHLSASKDLVYGSEEDVNIDDDDEDGQESAREEAISTTKEFQTGGLDIDINLPHPAEMEEDEIAVVDINDDESYKGLNAAEALRAQVNAEATEEERKSWSSSSGRESESSGSGSGSSSSSESRSGTASESGSQT